MGEPDKKYEAERNAFIPEAERYANELMGPKPIKISDDPESEAAFENYNAGWNTAFLGEMKRLWNGRVKRCELCGSILNG